MRYRHKLWFLFFLFCLCGAGCGKKETTLMGVAVNQIESCKVYHGVDEKDIDLTTEEGKEFLELLSEFFEKNRNRMGVMDCDQGLKWSQLGKFAERTENKDNYYIFFQFSGQQTITYNEKQSLLRGKADEKSCAWKGCDGLLLDVMGMLINCSKSEEFFGTLEINYADVAWDGFSEVYDAFMDME